MVIRMQGKRRARAYESAGSKSMMERYARIEMRSGQTGRKLFSVDRTTACDVRVQGGGRCRQINEGLMARSVLWSGSAKWAQRRSVFLACRQMLDINDYRPK